MSRAAAERSSAAALSMRVGGAASRVVLLDFRTLRSPITFVFFNKILQTNDLSLGLGSQSIGNKGDNFQSLRNRGVMVLAAARRHNPEAGGFYLLGLDFNYTLCVKRSRCERRHLALSVWGNGGPRPTRRGCDPARRLHPGAARRPGRGAGLRGSRSTGRRRVRCGELCLIWPAGGAHLVEKSRAVS